MFDAALVPVSVGACRCPGTPHPDGDEVFLYPELPISVGIRCHAAMAVLNDAVEITAQVLQILTEGCIADWTILGADGAKLEINPATIRGALPYNRGGKDVVEAVAARFTSDLTNPTKPPRREAKTPTSISSRTGRTAKASTSPSPTTKPTPPAPSA